MNAPADLFEGLREDLKEASYLIDVQLGQPPAIEPWSEDQWKRILRRLPFRVVTDVVKAEYAANRTVQCMGCKNALGHGGDPWGAWCVAHRRRVSNTFPKLCREHRPA